VLVSIYILAHFLDGDDFVDTAQDGIFELKKELNRNTKNVYNREK
jgi:hypothetical protein